MVYTYHNRYSSQNGSHPDGPRSMTIFKNVNAYWRTMGKTVAVPGIRSLTIKRAPFSVRSPVRRVPLTEKFISVALGWVWGVLIAQGPRNPTAVISEKSNSFTALGNKMRHTHWDSIANNSWEIGRWCGYRMTPCTYHNAGGGTQKVENELGWLLRWQQTEKA